MGALDYNLKKIIHPDSAKRAELLYTNFTTLDKAQIRQEVELLRQLRPGLNRYVYHTSLNFAKEDNLNNDQLVSIALQYLEANGFTNNQYLIFRHYDAEHMHLHLLVNRITFDGGVVSDSNNYKKSEAVLRGIERQYKLTHVEPSSKVQQRAAKKDELEMVMRTGLPSDKMVLQELIRKVLADEKLTLSEFIKQGENAGINFLFNQASTGRISGITYFYQGFKIKGQALGNSFKWAELIRTIDYEQIRDGKAVSEANDRTKARYDRLATNAEVRSSGVHLTRRGTPVADRDAFAAAEERGDERELPSADQGGTAPGHAADSQPGSESDLPEVAVEQGRESGDSNGAAERSADSGIHHYTATGIANDVDDEAIYGRNRRRQRKARQNAR